MSTKAAAIQKFMGGFGIPAYAVSSVPDDAEMPYITYTLVSDAFTGAETNMTVDIWYYGDGEVAPNAKAQEVSKALGLGGKMLPCDDGAIWVKRGSPFCQVVTDSTDDKVKRRYINLSLEFITND